MAELMASGNFSNPGWSSDGKKIVFHGIIDLKYDADLYVMTLK